VDDAGVVFGDEAERAAPPAFICVLHAEVEEKRRTVLQGGTNGAKDGDEVINVFGVCQAVESRDNGVEMFGE
jgi:hypothetical protein